MTIIHCEAAGLYDSVVCCSECEAELSRETVTVDALGHTVEELAEVPATCTESGLTAGSKCTVCNAILVAQETVNAIGQ